MLAEVVLHEFGHQGIDGAAGGGEALQGIGAGLVLVEGAKDTFELANDFFGAFDQVQFFSRWI